MLHTIDEALEQLLKGKMIIVVDDEDRENEGDFVALAEYVTPDTINAMATYGKGLICTPISTSIAQKLKLTPMVTNNTDNHGTAFTVSIDYKETETGISAFERALTIEKMIGSDEPTDFRRPGHIFPLIAKDGGVLERRGHTEAAVELAKLAGVKEAGIICEIMSADGHMARLPELERISRMMSCPLISIEQLVEYVKQQKELVTHG